MNFEQPSGYHPTTPQAYLDPASNTRLYSDFSGWHAVSRNSSTDRGSQPIFYSSVYDPSMDYSAQPSLSVGKLRSDRKRKAEDERDVRRVRSGAPPPSDLALVQGFDFMQQPARQWARAAEDEHLLREEGGGNARALEGVGWSACSSSSPDVGVTPHSTGQWAFVKNETRGFEEEGRRHGEALRRSSTMSSKGCTPPRLSGYEASDPSLPPMMHGIPPGYIERQQVNSGMACIKRKRGEIAEAEDDEGQMQPKRSQTNADFIQEMKRARPTHVQSEANNASSPRLPELDATIPTFRYSGLKLGQLLPCGEILGFVELPPLAQLYDIYSISLIRPPPEHAWIQEIWSAIKSSIGIHAPTWHANYWHDEITRSGTERKILTLSAIKTFRELGERLLQSSISELMEETLNLFHKEMDYTVLLLLVHRHEQDRVIWEQRLKVLFARLDPALRQQNTPTNRLVTSVPNSATTSDTQSLDFDAAPFIQASGLPAVKDESREQAMYFNPWPYPAGSSAQSYTAESTLAVKDEPMGMLL